MNHHSTHTPGQWIADDDRLANYYYIQNEYGTVIAHVMQLGVPPDQRVPNARLIAAAPQLLDALKALVEDVMTSEHLPHDWSEQVVIRNARAAIAAATKGQP